MAKILIIDDSSTARTLLRSALNEKKYEVSEAASGPEALEYLSSDKGTATQLILCDINMPQMDGLTLCRRIKAMPAFTNLPILMVTTESSTEMKNKGKEIGVLGWVTKPFDPVRLAATIDKLVGVSAT